MKDQYLFRETLLIGNQLLVISYLCIMAAAGNVMGWEHFAGLLLLSLLFFDAAYISYRNVKGNQVLSHFSYLLTLLGWQLLLPLFENSQLSEPLSLFLLPVCLYQSFYFIQVFAFQESAYRLRKFFLAVCKITCGLSVIGFFFSEAAFSSSISFKCCCPWPPRLPLGLCIERELGLFSEARSGR